MNFCLLKNIDVILNPSVSDKNKMEILLQLSSWEHMDWEHSSWEHMQTLHPAGTCTSG